MNGTQHAASDRAGARFALWPRTTDTGLNDGQLRGQLRAQLLGCALLLTAACTADITGGGSTQAPTANAQIEEEGADAGILEDAGRGARSWTPMDMPNNGKGQAGAAGSGQAGKGANPAARSGGAGGKAAAGGAAGKAAGSAAVGGEAGEGGGGSGGGTEPTAAGAGGTSADAGSDEAVTAGAVRWVGRVDDRDPEAVRFSWAGAGLKAVVEGNTLAVRLESIEDDVYYQPVIDGEAGDRIRVAVGEHVVTLASGLSDGEHQLELYRETEGDGPVSVFRGFEQGTLVGAPAVPERFFELVGDSISVGLGALGTERHGSNPGPGCGGDHSSSSWFLTYGAVAARELDAEVSTIARSGFGMVRGYGQNMNVMPPLFDDTLAGSNSLRWSFERIPAALVINLGTNDWNGGDPGASYETAYLSFLTQVREHYPDTLILLTIGPTLEDGIKRQVVARLERVIEERGANGDDKIAIIDIGIQSTDVTGCAWHPSAAEHLRVGKVLAEELRTRLSW